MPTTTKQYAQELAQALEESADGDGCHLGSTDSLLAARALRALHEKPPPRRNGLKLALAICGLFVAACAGPFAETSAGVVRYVTDQLVVAASQ